MTTPFIDQSFRLAQEIGKMPDLFADLPPEILNMPGLPRSPKCRHFTSSFMVPPIFPQCNKSSVPKQQEVTTPQHETKIEVDTKLAAEVLVALSSHPILEDEKIAAAKQIHGV
jgi:hypothetical protein